MRRCLIWGTGYVFADCFNLVESYASQGVLRLDAITSNEIVYESVYGIPFVKKKDISCCDYDIVVVMADGSVYIDILNELHALGFDDSKIIPYKVLKQFGFGKSIDSYMRLRSNPPTIFSPNCWGGITYNMLGLRLDSPFINMFVLHDDYLRLLKNPKHYLQHELVLDRFEWEVNIKKKYPVARCDDVFFHFNHYTDFENAYSDWKRRVSRVKWDNLFVFDFEHDRHHTEEFMKLEYKKKICFTSFETSCIEGDDSSLVYLDFVKCIPEKPIWDVVIDLAYRRYLFYDPIELLLNGRIKRITVGA